MLTTPTKAPRRKANRGRTATGAPNPIDAHVGARMRLRRTLLGLSQERLGELIDLTFQQIQKYEKGANRISCSRLFDLGRALDVPVSYFFDGMADDVAAASPSGLSAGAAAPAEPEADPAMRRETLELVRNYYAIPQPAVRARVYDLAKTLAGIVAEGRQAPFHIAAE